jgi:hypothetical protein
MKVILLERVESSGQMGDVVRVKDGFARNFLLPKKKALRATKANRDYFQTQKAQLEARNLERKKRSRSRPRSWTASLRADPPGRRPRPALWFGQPPRRRRRRDAKAASRSTVTR